LEANVDPDATGVIDIDDGTATVAVGDVFDAFLHYAATAGRVVRF